MNTLFGDGKVDSVKVNQAERDDRRRICHSS